MSHLKQSLLMCLAMLSMAVAVLFLTDLLSAWLGHNPPALPAPASLGIFVCASLVFGASYKALPEDPP